MTFTTAQSLHSLTEGRVDLLRRLIDDLEFSAMEFMELGVDADEARQSLSFERAAELGDAQEDEQFFLASIKAALLGTVYPGA